MMLGISDQHLSVNKKKKLMSFQELKIQQSERPWARETQGGDVSQIKAANSCMLFLQGSLSQSSYEI